MDKIKNYVPELIYLILLISTGLIPNYGALDRIATQWFYLSLLNTIGLSIFLVDKKYKHVSFKSLIKFKPLLFLMLFIVWGISSYLYAINSTEVIVKIIRWIQLPISLSILMMFFNTNHLNYVSIISVMVTCILFVELYFSYSTYFDLTKFTSYNFSYAYLIKGATGNKNINAASILIKIPFVLLLLFRQKTLIVKILLGLLIAFTCYLVLILSARAAILSLILITVVLSIKTVAFLISKRNFPKDLSSLIMILSFAFPILLFSLQYSSNNTASIANRVSTINTEDTSTQQRLRYYQHSFDQLIDNPLVGVGLGNWKIKSVDYDKKDIVGYIMPYHTHNDFLEIGAELGLIGLILYLLIFLKPVLTVLNKKTIEKLYNTNTLILLSGIIYFIDASLNFPHARPVMQIPFLLILVFSFHQSIKLKENE